MTKRNKSINLTYIDGLVVVFVCLFLTAIITLAANRSRFDAFRIECAKNLSNIGKAMLIYSSDYDDQYPRAGGPTSIWSWPVHWDAVNRFQAYGLSPNGSGGRATISSSLYLLVKYTGLAPKSFICPGDIGTTEFKLSELPDVPPGFEIVDAWDFGPDVYKHCSYAYHLPYGQYALTTSSEPGMAVAADRNPWMDSPAGSRKDMALFKPDGGREGIKVGNAIAHQEEGQNVLFLDGHVDFEEVPFCGVNEDNIYTFWDGIDKRFSLPPTAALPETTPMDKEDSLLVHDPIRRIVKQNVTHAELASKPDLKVKAEDLKHTVVTPHLNYKIEPGMNVLWCSTFQLAWNDLCDLIGGPIIMESAPAISAELNKRTASKDDLDQASYVALAGRPVDGIYDKIRNQLKEKFQGQAVPELFENLPGKDQWVAVAYAYLFKALPFEWAFKRFDNNLRFEGYYVDSFGICQLMDSDYGEVKMASQVLILDYQSRDNFVIELKTMAKDDRLILAKVPALNTLAETVRMVERRMVNTTPKKMPIFGDLYVPVLNFDILREYSELYSHPVKASNKLFDGIPLEYAAQSIRFRLDEMGAVLISESIMAVPAGGRYLIFD